jgi:hypothetical protein
MWSDTDNHDEAQSMSDVARRGRLLPRRKIAEKDGISVRSQVRREKSDPTYPEVIEIGGRKYIYEDEHDAWRAAKRERENPTSPDVIEINGRKYREVA